VRRIAIGLALACASCGTDSTVTFAIGVRVARPSTQVDINGTIVDGGGAVPRTVSVSYDLPDWTAAKNTHYLLESFAGGGKLGELTVTPTGCDPAGAETAVIDLHNDGTFAIAADRCN
jgi:hypothetical protein